MARQEPPQMPPIGSIVHTELVSDDPSATKQFLSKVFDWTFEKMSTPAGDYHMLQTPGGGRGGLRNSGDNEKPIVTNYILVDDLDAAQKKVEKAGGRIVLPRTDVPGMGSFFWFEVPGGVVMACWQPAQD
jgi:hypothetical protein